MNLVLARVFVVIVFNIIGPIRNYRLAFSLPRLKKLMIVHSKNFFPFIRNENINLNNVELIL